MTVDIYSYPKFIDHCIDDGCYTWLESFQKCGFKSVMDEYPFGIFELDDMDYTMFILRFR